MEYNIEKLIYLFENNNDVTFILQNDLAFDLVEQLEVRCHRFCDGMTLEDVKELYESNVLMISKSESFGQEECFFEVAYANEHLKYVEDCQLAIIEEGVIEPWEIKEYVMGGYILFTFEDDYEEIEECDDTEEFISDTMDELLHDIDNLNGNGCVHCLIESYLLDMYESGYKDGIRDSIEQLENNLKEQF